MNFENGSDAISFINAATELSLDESFDLAVLCTKLSDTRPGEKVAREIVIRVLDKWSALPEETRPIWNDLTESVGLYPYMESRGLDVGSALRHEAHKSPYLSDIYLHREQQTLSMGLQSKESIVVSAPTSFGKSLLIEEVIASRLYSNIVIIQPTLALLDETRKKLLKYRDHYDILVATSQLPRPNSSNVFLFTAERVVEYDSFPQIDFFVIDEFYKLSIQRDDERAISLNLALYKLLKHTQRFYMLGPVVKDISVSFKTGIQSLRWVPTEFATVAVNESRIEFRSSAGGPSRKHMKMQRLFKLLTEYDDTEQTLIYCSSPGTATALCFEFAEFLAEHAEYVQLPDTAPNRGMVEWTTINIHRDWTLVECLKFGTAVHHGGLPRHLGSSIVDAFNAGSIRWLFCTSTLIEGVNTTAKNVVLFHKKKGVIPIDFFDYKNIAGRSGRMKKHFVGNVISFEEQPPPDDVELEIPLFDQQGAPVEILISLEPDEVRPEAQSRLKEFNALPAELQEVIKANKGMSVEGQVKIVEAIEAELDRYHALLNWTGYPTFEQLAAVLELCWENFLTVKDRKTVGRIGRLSARWLAVFAKDYVDAQSIGGVIARTIASEWWKERVPDLQERVNTVTLEVLHIGRHWFDYKLPKWLATVSALQKYVFAKHQRHPGDYVFLAANLEKGFLTGNLAVLSEYAIPLSATKKLRTLVDAEQSADQILRRLQSLTNEQLIAAGLIDYEILKIRAAG
ncbi:MAG: helicase-related protein [Pyrinomonadaceae bacterium]